MKVCELITKLQSLPKDAHVEFLYDLGCHESVDYAWLARNGKVYVTDKGQWFHDEDLWPKEAKANFKGGVNCDGELNEWCPDL